MSDTKKPDDNELLMRGELPMDPFAGAVPVVSQAEGGIMGATSPEEARSEPPLSQAGRAGSSAAPPATLSGLAQELPALADEPRLLGDALYGLPGDFVRLVEPHTEASPVSLLAQFLAAIGCMIARSVYVAVGATKHHLNIFCSLVGPSSKARKGSSWEEVRAILVAIDPGWVSERIASGLVSGEGLVDQVRDAQYKYVLDKKSGEYVQQLVDEGVKDKRLLVQESEFARALAAMARENSTLSMVLREAWDRGDLCVLAKTKFAKATGAHVAIVAHVTLHELTKRLGEVELFNGFANRLLWIYTRRTRLLPDGGNVPAAARDALVQRVREVVKFASSAREMSRNHEAAELWRRIYPTLTADRPGLLGVVTGRAEAQVVRLSALYAVCDRSIVVKAEHLRAGLALWKYAEDSARRIFGTSLGDPLADAFAVLLRERGRLTRTEIREAVGNHKKASAIESALGLLAASGLARRGMTTTDGRSAEVWTWVGEPDANAAYASVGVGILGSRREGRKGSEGSEAIGGHVPASLEGERNGREGRKESADTTAPPVPVPAPKPTSAGPTVNEDDPFALLPRFSPLDRVDSVPQRGVL